ncbi:hypothetical protein [Bacillus sp. FJAT-49736]|uniref:hypothetical protein n=1 Tax=Bacillus sp. FJAT-49736 TaxID=2833582 RepID=UPI001BC93EE3|nr:hypothetical protein [Bacillus sp. FJAT-49736]MBS4173484.1 hypothetical protein [Bacillus sp. FJAT-49736]
MSDIVQALESIKEVYINIPKRIEELENHLRNLDNEQQDLLHFMEFAKPDAREMIRKYKELRNTRNERRKVKDELELLQSAKEIFSYQKLTEKNVGKVLGNVHHVLNVQENRCYTMKVRKDLQELIR